MKKILLISLLYGISLHAMNGESLHDLSESFHSFWHWLTTSREQQMLEKLDPNYQEHEKDPLLALPEELRHAPPEHSSLVNRLICWCCVKKEK